jgi:hypothetical protein
MSIDTILRVDPIRVWGLENRQSRESMSQSNNQKEDFVLLWLDGTTGITVEVGAGVCVVSDFNTKLF